MLFANLFKRKETAQKEIPRKETPQKDFFAKDFEHLDEKGELPFGWIHRNKEFVEQIQSEFTYMLNMWLDSKKKSPIEYRNALKSFVVYLEDVQKLCKSKGECFEFWYSEILTSQGYLEKRKQELTDLLENLDKLQDVYVKKQELKPAIVCLLKENDGILQSDFKWLFDEAFHTDVLNMLYEMHKSGEIERIKSGKSYILHYKERK